MAKKNTTPKKEERPLTEYRYTVLFDRLPEGGYQAFVPSLPEIVTYGETLDEARAMAEDAIKCVLQSMKKNNEPIPSDIEEAAREKLAVTIS